MMKFDYTAKGFRFFVKSLMTFIFPFSLFIPSFLLAQNIEVAASLDTNELLIGDQTVLILSASYPEEKILIWPQIGDTIITGIEVLNRTVEDTISDANSEILLVERSYTITSFDSGIYKFLPFLFSFADDTTSIMGTDTVLLAVKTIKVDTTIAIKEIKSPLDVPYTLDEFIPHILIGLAILLALFLAYFVYRKYKKRPIKVVEIPEPVIPAHITALERLKDLEERKLWQKEKVKLYYVELSEITRTYIENRFDVIAMELTTDEIIAAMSFLFISEESKNELIHLLRLADMVKFAKYKPIHTEHEACMKHAYRFVNATKEVLIKSEDQVDIVVEPRNLPPK